MARTASRDRARQRAAPAPVVVQPPPNETEKYSYVNRNLPYLFISLTIGFLSVTISQVFMEEHIRAALILVPFTALNAFYQLISIPINFTGRKFDVVAHRARVKAWQPEWYPVVDIFLPICGEPAEVLHNTWTAVAAVIANYPGTAYAHVLDDGDDQVAAVLADSYGFNYVVRPNRGWYRKAGNLRNAFEHTRGDFFLILDADFAPRPEILAEMLPYFDEPDVGIVQTPQFFRTTPEQSWVERAGATIQEVFYRSIQVARDRYGAAICVGTCAVYRRKALEPHGGPALIAYAEDVHTGLDIHKDGYRLVYIPVNLATGMCPDNVHAFVHQQCRWATGNMFTVILSRLWTVPMTVRARLSHISGFFYYLSSAIAVFTLPAAPVILLAFSPKSIKISNLLLFGPSLFTGMVMYPLWHRSDYRLREILPLTLIRGWAHVLAIWDYVLGRTLSWQPSGASVSRVSRLWWSLILWNGSVAVAWLGLTAWRIDTTRSPQFLITAVTGILNLVIVCRAVYGMTHRAQVREEHRRELAVAGVPPRRIALKVSAVAASLALLAAIGGYSYKVYKSAHRPIALPPVHLAMSVTPDSYLGVYEQDSPFSYGDVEQFAQTAGHEPNLVLYYSGWGTGFQTSFARTALAHNATVLVDLDPTTTTLASIADGQDDSFLVNYAQEVVHFGHPVVIAFAHEMNGSWYPWGFKHSSPQVYVQAWRHIVTLFRTVGADNVTWLWTVNAESVGEGPIQDWWPGAKYVTWVGIDGYYYYSAETFSTVFGPTIQTIHQIADKPILISETAVGQLAGKAQKIPGLFAGVRQAGLLGLVWFDVAQNDGEFHQNWRLEGHVPAETAFRQGVQGLFTLSPSSAPSPPSAQSPSSARSP
jgi:cellulose synthase (UDP-forming)